MENRILVVDDEPEIADLVTVYLRGEGFQVFPCGSGREVWLCWSGRRSIWRCWM